VISWLVAALGFFVGLFALAKFGMWRLPLGDHDPGWLLRWLTFVGIALFGVGFLVGSLFAPRNPRRAGAIFLTFLPITAFCLAYQESGFLVWRADGGWFEPPFPLTAIALTLLFYAPFAAPLITLRNKKRAAFVFGVAALVAALVFIRSRWTPVLVPPLAGYSTPFILFGSFWLGTHKFGWPVLVQARSGKLGRWIAVTGITSLVILCLDLAMTLMLSALGSSLFQEDCNGKSPITHRESPKHAVFTARVIFAGRSIWALTRGQGTHGLPVGDWAIGIVQQKFWGVPSAWPHLVLMTDYIYWKDESYFIDGVRQNGWVTRMLPIVEARVGCSRSRPEQDAVVDLRVLREGPPIGRTRLVGYVRRPQVFAGVFAPPAPPSFVTSVKISVTGSAGTYTASTDQSGVYELDGLPPGDYTLQLAVPDSQMTGSHERRTPPRGHLDKNAVVEHNFELAENRGDERHDGADTAKR